MVVKELAIWHVLASWRDDAEIDLRCRSCGVPIAVGDTYRVAGIALLCTLRPFCPAPTLRVIEPERRRSPQWKRRRRTVLVSRPSGPPALLADCRCGARYRQVVNKGRPQQACSRACTYRLLEARAAEGRQRACVVCAATFAPLSSHPKQQACSPSCGARLRERRKREGVAA